MKCPKCTSNMSVTDSRPIGNSVRRQRKCDGCDLRITTLESITFTKSGSAGTRWSTNELKLLVENWPPTQALATQLDRPLESLWCKGRKLGLKAPPRQSKPKKVTYWRWTPEMDEHVKANWPPTPESARAIYKSVQACIERGWKFGLKVRQSKPPQPINPARPKVITPEMAEVIRAGYKTVGPSALARQLGLSKNTVISFGNNNNLCKRQPTTPALSDAKGIENAWIEISMGGADEEVL